MSVIVISKFRGDPARLETYLRTRPAEVQALSATARSNGALHHRIVAGKGEVVVIDEWSTAEGYDTIYPGQPGMIQALEEAGLEEPPEVAYFHSLSDPGEF